MYLHTDTPTVTVSSRDEVGNLVLRIAREEIARFTDIQIDLHTDLAAVGIDSITYYSIEARVEDALNVEFGNDEFNLIDTLQNVVDNACRALDIP